MCIVAQSVVSDSETPWTVNYLCQDPLSMGFFRQEYWSGLPFSSSRGSSGPRDQTGISGIAGAFFTRRSSGEALESGTAFI